MKVSSELLASLSQATRTSVPPGTEVEVPELVLPVASFGTIPDLATSVVGRTFSNSFLNDAQIDQTNVAASSRVLFALTRGLWRVTWSFNVTSNFAPTFGSNFSTLAFSYDGGASFVRFASLAMWTTPAEFNDRGVFTVMVGSQNLQIVEFEFATTGVGNRAIWTTGFIGEKLL